MNLIERATIVHYHRQRMAAFGEESPEALGWRNVDSQLKRFEAIAAAGGFNGCSVLDVGCGRGDLKRFLDARFKEFYYIGLDHMPAFIEQARQAYAGAPETLFVECDFSSVTLPAVDYVIASGALGYRSADPTFHLKMIGKMYECARRAVIFNVLDAALFPEHPLLVGRNRDEVLGYCSKIAPHVGVITGYLADDVTLGMYRACSWMPETILGESYGRPGLQHVVFCCAADGPRREARPNDPQ